MSRRSKARRDRQFSVNPYKIYRPKRLCELLDIDSSTLWLWRKRGIVPEPAFRAGKISRWTEEQVAALFKQREIKGEVGISEFKKPRSSAGASLGDFQRGDELHG